MPRKVFLVGIVAILLFAAFPAGGEDPPQPPDLAVGIIPFTRTEAVLNCHIEQRINNLLDIHGARVTLIDASIEVPAAFASHPNLDFVVTGAVMGGETPLFSPRFSPVEICRPAPRTEHAMPLPPRWPEK